MGQFLNLNGWARREHYDHYRNASNPVFGVCAEVDATRLWRTCSEPGGPSFFLAALFLVLRATNGTEALRRRLRGGGVWLHDRVRANSTVLRADETFTFGRFELRDTFPEFQALGRAEVERARAAPSFGGRHDDDDLIYHVSLPWVRFTGISNPRDAGTDSIPRVVVGRCSPDGERWRLPVAVEVHHALVDGLDVARFLERVECGLADAAFD